MLKTFYKIINVILIWCSLLFSAMLLIYLIHGEGIFLLKVDILHLFGDNSRIFWREIFPVLSLITIFLSICIVKKRAYSFTIRISLKGKTKKFNICYLQIMNQYINYVTFFSVFFAVILGGYGICRYKKMEERNDFLPEPIIIHGMGIINGQPYTNSMEAFQDHYAKGQRFFETDFCLTKDNHLVARHDWEAGWQEGIYEGNIPTEDVFVNTPLFGKYTPLSLKDIIGLMQKYDDIHIITDTKDIDPGLARHEIQILVETAKELDAMEVIDRFVIQIYSIEMYEAIKDIYTFNDYIFTLYAIWDGDEKEFIDYCRFSKMNGIRTITIWDYRCADNPNLCRIADKYGIAIYVHTVNDQTTADKMLSLGVRGIYTDDEATVQNVFVSK